MDAQRESRPVAQAKESTLVACCLLRTRTKRLESAYQFINASYNFHWQLQSPKRDVSIKNLPDCALNKHFYVLPATIALDPK